MDAFRLAKEATLRALDSPMTTQSWSGKKAAREGGRASCSSRGGISGGGGSSSSSGSGPLLEARNQGVRLVEVRTRRRRGTDDAGEGGRSRL
ncbi:unnamed protein product [Hapterophycus canaliculatus]